MNSVKATYTLSSNACDLCWFRFAEYLLVLHANLAKYCLELSAGNQPLAKSVLEYTRGGATSMYTFIRICNSHFCHATANHGKFGEHFKGLAMTGVYNDCV